MGDPYSEGMLAAKPADGAHELSFIDELDRSLWEVVITVFDIGVYVSSHICRCVVDWQVVV